ncbi:MAG: hypothetical protein AB1476_03780 [Candidatus Hadarchaeota archaeon]
MFKKPLTGIAASLVVFSATIIALNLTLRWPNSPFTLGVALFISWFIGAAAYSKISDGNRRGGIPVTAIALALAAGTLVAGVPWDVGWRLVAPAQIEQENVWFKMQAYFMYRGPENGGPAENVVIWFPYPKVENSPIFTHYDTPGTLVIWALYYQENDNTLTRQQDFYRVYGFRGQRSENLNDLLGGPTLTQDGPQLFRLVDKLYPREVLWVDVLVYTQRENENKVTLRIYGDNKSGAQYWYPWNPNLPAENQSMGTPIDVSYWAQLSRRKPEEENYNIIETFSRSKDNAAMFGQWLYPS